MKPAIGNIYKRHDGRVVQVLDVTDREITLHWLEGCRFSKVGESYTYALYHWYLGWDIESDILDSHPRASVVCADCQKFCNQQCQIKKPNAFKQTFEIVEIRLLDRQPQFDDDGYNIWA